MDREEKNLEIKLRRMAYYRYQSPFKDKPNYENAHLSKLQQPIEIQKQISKWMTNPRGFLTFCGNPGIGKTYLCAALINYLIEIQIPFRYWEERQLLAKLREAIRDGQDPELTLKYATDEYFLFINDFGSSQNATEWQEDQLFNLIDERYMSQMPTVFTTNLFKKDILERYHERIVSRMTDKGNLFIECSGEDKRSS